MTPRIALQWSYGTIVDTGASGFVQTSYTETKSFTPPRSHSAQFGSVGIRRVFKAAWASTYILIVTCQGTAKIKENLQNHGSGIVHHKTAIAGIEFLGFGA